MLDVKNIARVVNLMFILKLILIYAVGKKYLYLKGLSFYNFFFFFEDDVVVVSKVVGNVVASVLFSGGFDMIDT